MDSSPNEFYSVLIQTSGVIVAIVGGFLASAWINYSTKKAGIEEQIARLEHEIQFNTQGIEKDRDKARQARDAWKYRDTIPQAVAIAEGEAAAKEIYKGIKVKRELVETSRSRVEHLRDQLAKMVSPDPYIRIASIALGVLTMVGMVVPLFLLATTFDDHHSCSPLAVFALFVVSMAGMLAYARWRLRKRASSGG